jgi:hypothetical protein
MGVEKVRKVEHRKKVRDQIAKAKPKDYTRQGSGVQLTDISRPSMEALQHKKYISPTHKLCNTSSAAAAADQRIRRRTLHLHHAGGVLCIA